MTRQGVEVLPVVDAGNVVGQLSMASVLRAQGQQTDPMTGLPWATALRSWATNALKRGYEISILFIDLDNFGEVNKVLGHVAGDDVLRSIARLLGSLIDPSTDLLCRYGGDEFAVATTRRADDVRALGSRIENQVVIPVDMGGVPRKITVSVGAAGGRRSEGREPTHVPATVEDLLMLASRASTAVKKTKSLGPALPTAGRPSESTKPLFQAGGPRIRLINVDVRTGQGRCAAAVTLSLDRRGVGYSAGPVMRREDVLARLADATLAAIRRTVGAQHVYVLEELIEVPTAQANVIVVVLAGPSNDARRYVGGAIAEDPNIAVTKAILAALNRTLAYAVTRHGRE